MVAAVEEGRRTSKSFGRCPQGPEGASHPAGPTYMRTLEEISLTPAKFFDIPVLHELPRELQQ